MQGIPNAPVPADDAGEIFAAPGMARQIITCFRARLATAPAASDELAESAEAGPVMALLPPFDAGDDLVMTRLDTAMIASVVSWLSAGLASGWSMNRRASS